MLIQHIRRPPLLLLVPVAAALVGIFVMGGTQRAFAWAPDDWGPGVSNSFEKGGCCSSISQGVNDWGGEGGGYWNQQWDGYGLDLYQTGWNHGVADAQYDHLHSLVYNNNGACHSSTYWEGFHKGYDTQWNIYQNTEQEQVQKSQQTINNYINIHGNDNVVNLNDRQSQNSEQEDQTSNANAGPDVGTEEQPYQQQQPNSRTGE